MDVDDPKKKKQIKRKVHDRLQLVREDDGSISTVMGCSVWLEVF